MKKNTFIILLCMFLFSCKDINSKKIRINSDNTEIPTIDLGKIKKHLALQKNYEVEGEENLSKQYYLTDEDIELGFQIIQHGLIEKGVHIPSLQEYESIIKKKFGNILNCTKCSNVIQHKNFITYLKPSPDFVSIAELRKSEYDYSYEHLFFSKKYRIIIKVPLLADYTSIENNQLIINIPENLVAINKYILNDDLEGKEWLLNNNKDFLFDLVSVFGNNNKGLNKIGLNEVSGQIIKSIESNKYYKIKEKECDLNEDGYKDIIIVFANNYDVNPVDPNTKIAPICVLLNNQNKGYKQFINYNIYPNNFGDFFKNLVIKNSFFTIELGNVIPDNYTSEKYITFKYDWVKQTIVLHKYGENIIWDNKPKTSILCSENQFGNILFEEFNSNTIRDLCE